MSGDTWKRRAMASWLSGDGIEIGALHNPLHLPAAAKARYVDRATMKELQAQYPEQSDLVPVSIVGDACDLRVLKDESVDFVVANHVIEHLPDPISGLQEMARVTRPGGLLYLAIPDQRATFDRRRPVTTTAHLVDEFRHGTERTRRAHVQEFVELAEHAEPVRPEDNDAVTARVNELLSSDYSIHYHVFRPDSFTDLLHAAKNEAGVSLEIVAFAACDGSRDDEFIFVLGKGISPVPRSAPEVGARLLSEHGGYELLAEVRRRGYRRLRRTLHA